MTVIKVSDLKEGTRFTKPVYVDDSNLLVAENVPLKRKEIDRLLRWGIEDVRTEGEPIGADGLPESGLRIGAFADSLKNPAQLEVFKTYLKFVDRFRTVESAIGAQASVETSEIDKIVDGLVSLVSKSRNDLIQFLLFGSKGEADSAQNSVNTTVYSIIIGANLNMLQHKLMQLATGALLHDAGMARVPEEILNKKGKLQPDELQRVKAHTIYSYRIITKELRYPDDIGLIALQHHERWDGDGYPKQLAGKQISLAARIVAVADAFEAMVTERPYRNSMIGYTAMRTLLGDNGRRFDPEVLKVFVRSMGVYPIGSIVLLSNSCIARVADTNGDAPLRPRVKVIIDKVGAVVEDGELIDLNADKKVFIAKAIDPKTLGKSGKE